HALIARGSRDLFRRTYCTILLMHQLGVEQSCFRHQLLHADAHTSENVRGIVARLPIHQGIGVDAIDGLRTVAHPAASLPKLRTSRVRRSSEWWNFRSRYRDASTDVMRLAANAPNTNVVNGRPLRPTALSACGTGPPLRSGSVATYASHALRQPWYCGQLM